MQKTKSLLVKVLVVLLTLCCSLGLVFGLVGCGGAVKGIDKTVIENGKLVIYYTDGTTSEPLDVQGPAGSTGAPGADANACAHENVIEGTRIPYAMAAGEYSDDICYMTMVICEDCGHVIVTKTGHTLVDDIVAATCTKEGYDGEMCECGYKAPGGLVLDKLPHDTEEVTNINEVMGAILGITIDPCTTDYYTDATICKVCGELSYTVNEATGHNYVNVEIGQYASNTAKFQVIADCDVCGERDVVILELDNLVDDMAKEEPLYSYEKTGVTTASAHQMKITLADGEYDIVGGQIVVPATEEGAEDTYVKVWTAEDVDVAGSATLIAHCYGGATIPGSIADYTAAKYPQVILNAGVELSCDVPVGGVVVCDVCNTAVNVAVSEAHVRNEEVATVYDFDELNSYTDGLTDCTKAHVETYECKECGGNYDVEVANEAHTWVYDRINAVTGKAILECSICEQTMETAVTDSEAPTCNADGWIWYDADGDNEVDDGEKTSVGATRVHKLGDLEIEAGDVLDYVAVKDYIGTKIVLDAGQTEIVCGATVNAQLLCDDGVQIHTVAVQVERQHVLAEDGWTVVTPATCTADGLEKQTCGLEDCGEEVTRPIVGGTHLFVFNSYAGGVLVVDCDRDGCDVDGINITVEDNDLVVIEIVDKTCIDEEENGTKFEFTYDGKDYVIFKANDVVAHKFAGEVHYEGDQFELGTAGIIPTAGSTPATCQDTQPAIFVCQDCGMAVSVELTGNHVYDMDDVHEEDCESCDYVECTTAGCGVTKPVEAVQLHDYVATVNYDAGVPVSVTFTCDDCSIALPTVLVADWENETFVDCETNAYTYTYVNGDFEQVFSFNAKTGSFAHEFVEDAEGNAVVYKFVEIDGVEVLYDALNPDHEGLVVVEYNYCTVCNKMIPA